MPAFNRLQWMDSFAGQLAILRPHLTFRVLDVMSTLEWNKHGSQDEDPIKAGKAWSAALDTSKKK